MRVELLFWAGCPSHEKALAELREILAEEGVDPRAVVVREIETEGDAASERFIGSPTIRFDGAEVQPQPNEPAGLTCRVYRRRDGRFSPTPDPEDVRDALRDARAQAHAAPPTGHSPLAAAAAAAAAAEERR